MSVTTLQVDVTSCLLFQKS